MNIKDWPLFCPYTVAICFEKELCVWDRWVSVEIHTGDGNSDYGTDGDIYYYIILLSGYQTDEKVLSLKSKVKK